MAILALSLLSATSFALFTATSSINGNSITNGTVTMSVTDPNGGTVNAFGTGPTASPYYSRPSTDGYALQNSYFPNNELNFAAGDTAQRAYKLNNTGSLDQYVRLYLSGLSLTYQDGGNQITVSDPSNPIFSNYTVYVFATNDHCGNLQQADLLPNTNDHYNDKQITRIGSFKDIIGNSNAVGAILNADTKLSSSAQENTLGDWAEYYLVVKLNSGALNNLQQATLSFNVNFEAVQVANNPANPQIGYQGFGGNDVKMTPSELSQISWN
jgi:predicted ribosomally synthesized peptide with SipW-like signal peptide